jgi:hypothetical protein
MSGIHNFHAHVAPPLGGSVTFLLSTPHMTGGPDRLLSNQAIDIMKAKMRIRGYGDPSGHTGPRGSAMPPEHEGLARGHRGQRDDIHDLNG